MINYEDLTSAEQHKIAREYCLNHPLHRPETNGLTAIIWILFHGLLAVFLAIFVLSLDKNQIITVNISFVELFILFFACVGILLFKRTVIGCIELYQHYAKEETRRKCILMPTCSEYAILAINKYGVIRGIIKTYKRLTITCRGFYYKIDLP